MQTWFRFFGWVGLCAGFVAVAPASAQPVSGGEGCWVYLRDGSEVRLDPEQCQRLAAQEDQDRSRRAERRERRLAERRARQAAEDAADVGKVEGWVLEAGLGFGGSVQRGKYKERLRDFGYEHDGASLGRNLRLTLSFGRRLLPNLLVGLSYASLEADDYERIRNIAQRFEWTGHALFGFVQGDLPFGRRRMLTLFGRVGAGVSYAWTTLDAVKTQPGFPAQSAALENTTQGTEKITQDYFRACGFVSAGAEWMPGRYFGMTFELRYVLAPAIRNELGDDLDLGGIQFGVSVRARTWE